MKLLAENIKKYEQSEQISILKNMINKIEKINDNILKKLNIHKKQLVSDIEILIDFSEVFLK
jgi:TnpA family transposase